MNDSNISLVRPDANNEILGGRDCQHICGADTKLAEALNIGSI